MNFWWCAFGFLGQLLFSLRFIIQWIASERRRESVIPIAFWYLSLGGSIIVLIYAIWRRDPVFIAAYSMGFFVYVRNLVLIYRRRNSKVV